ncbi:multicomponent Na+:H+ antiporter subunit G [Halanaerobium saccharolyticum]|uniref:Multicomponent Na+:H+ antiporter subunit G n=1 Tax=Halanaerobium saccharolyticum TaxID=43595 RepID=A0A4R6LK63_9FIRM|nr:monovalent cation/H(+) antiporter subunit G [Halanaerobium saccharolyticum]TDO84618.1 multicomponent Na+:H+ antiporter subunit G [Halanaerobium saccharolyticum]
MLIINILGYILILAGSLFLFLGALGLFRMPDVYNRLQAGTKATTLGALSTIIGVGMVETDWFFKTLIIAVFILMTNPIGSHSIARAARLSKIAVEKITAQDKYQEKHLNNIQKGSDQNAANL